MMVGLGIGAGIVVQLSVSSAARAGQRLALHIATQRRLVQDVTRQAQTFDGHAAVMRV